MKYDVIVIGSGLGGLECAHILSRAGQKVLVLEKGAQYGGCLQSYRRGGLAFDTGFHYVGGLEEGQSLYAAFKMLGLLQLPWHRLDKNFDRVRIGNRSFAFSQGYDDFVRTLAEHFPDEEAGLKKYAALLKQTNEHQLDVLNPKTEAASFASGIFEKGAWSYLQETFSDPLLINVLSGTSLKMELRKESLPLFTFAHGNSGFVESSWRLKGKGSLIADSLVKDIRSGGGEVFCRSEVEELVEKNGRIVSVKCTNGEAYEAGLFISDIHPDLTCGLIKQSEKIKKVYRRRIGSLENTFGMLTVSLVLKPDSLKYFNRNEYIYTRPDVWTFYQDTSSVGGVMISCCVPEEENGFTRQVDLLTPMMWKQCMPWVETRVGRRGESYVEQKEVWADKCIALAERAIPGLRKMVEKRYISTPLTYRDYTAAPEGSAYGLRKDYNSPLMTILSPRTPVPNLFLTGQSLMLHGIQGVTMTALFTCAEVLGKEYIWNELKKMQL